MPLTTATTLSSRRFITRSFISVVATLWFLYVFFRKNNTAPKLTYQATSSFIDGRGLYILGGLSVQKKKAVPWSSSSSSTTTRIRVIPSQTFMIDLSVSWSATHPVYKTLAPGPRSITSALEESASSSSSDTVSISSAITADRQHWFLLTTSITAKKKKKDSNKGSDSGGKSSKSTGYLYHFESRTWKEIPVDFSLSKNALSPSALTSSYLLPNNVRSQHQHHHQGTTDPDTGVIYMFLRLRPCHPDHHDCDQQPLSSSISPRGITSKDTLSSTPWWLWSINIHTKTFEFIKDVPPASVVHGIAWSPYRKDLLYIGNRNRSRSNRNRSRGNRRSSSSRNVNSKDNTTTYAARRGSGVENQTTFPYPGWFAYHPNSGWKDLTSNTTLSSSPSWSPPHRKGACFVPAHNGSKMVLFGGFKVQVEEEEEEELEASTTEENDNSQRKTRKKKKTKTRNKRRWINEEIAQSDIYILDVQSLTWSKGPSPSRLNARAYSACAASGDHFIAWGGIHRIVHGDTITTTTTTPNAAAAASPPPSSVADVTFPVDAVVIFSLTSGTWVSRYAPPGMDNTHPKEPFWYKYTDFQMCFHAGHCQEFMIGCLFLGQCILAIPVAVWWYYLRGRWSYRCARLFKGVPKV